MVTVEVVHGVSAM